MLSYAHGLSDEPLLGRDDRREPRAHDRAGPRRRRAGLVPPGRPLHVRRVRRGGRPARGGDARRRAAQGRPRRRVGAEPRRVGARPVRDRQARGDPRQHQPGVPDERARIRARAVGLPLAVRRARVSRARTSSRWSTRSARTCRGSSGRSSSTRDEWDELASGGASRRRGARARWRELDFDDPINIQYTSGTTGFPKGATLSHHNILNNGHFIAQLLGYTERDRVCIPVPLYHCFGMVIGNLACTSQRRVHRVSGRDVRPRGDAARVRAGALHEPLRRADDVHRRARPSAASPSTTSSSLRTGIMAGSPCPVEVMKRVSARDGDRADLDRLRPDRDLAR